MSINKVPIVIFASGRGSNFDAIVDTINSGKLNAEITALVCDQPGAPVLVKARKAGINTLLIPFENNRDYHESKILDSLSTVNFRFLVLSGYMRIITPIIINKLKSHRGYSRIANIHPSILPSFPGLNSYGKAFNYGCKIAGVTVHLVDNNMDDGPICAQEAFSIEDCKDETEVENRGLIIEHRLYSETLEWVLREKFDVEERMITVHSGTIKRRMCVRTR